MPRAARLLSFLLLLSLPLLAWRCEPAQTAATPPAVLLRGVEGTWLHSFEDDLLDTLVYRPNTYAFPPARRGRTGFQFNSYGRFTQFDIAPTDGLLGRPGRWSVSGPGRVQIVLDSTGAAPPDGVWRYELEVLKFKKNLLKIRRLAGGR